MWRSEFLRFLVLGVWNTAFGYGLFLVFMIRRNFEYDKEVA
jgi:putative flippase GtrA